MNAKTGMANNGLERFLPILALVLIFVLYGDVLLSLLIGWVQPTEENLHSLVSLGLLGLLFWKTPESLVTAVPLEKQPTEKTIGLAVMVVSLALLAIARVLAFHFLQQLSLILMGWGWVMLYLSQKPRLAGGVFTMFLIQAIPWMLVIPMTVPLQILATKLSASAAMMLGWPVTYSYNLITLNEGSFQVTSPCSGINSLVGLSFVWFLLAMMHNVKSWQALAGLPLVWGLAILLNAVRIFLTLFWGVWIDFESAYSAHEYLGFITFFIGMGLLYRVSSRFLAHGK